MIVLVEVVTDFRAHPLCDRLKLLSTILFCDSGATLLPTRVVSDFIVFNMSCKPVYHLGLSSLWTCFRGKWRTHAKPLRPPTKFERRTHAKPLRPPHQVRTANSRQTPQTPHQVRTANSRQTPQTPHTSSNGELTPNPSDPPPSSNGELTPNPSDPPPSSNGELTPNPSDPPLPPHAAPTRPNTAKRSQSGPMPPLAHHD